MKKKGYRTMGGAIEAAHKMNVSVIAVWQYLPDVEGPHAGRWSWAAAGSKYDRYVDKHHLSVAGSRRVVMIAVVS